MKQISLVEYLAYVLGLEYISDLRFPEKLPQGRLRYILECKISAADFPEKEWLDACEYLSGEKQDTGEEARSYILRFLAGDKAWQNTAEK